MMSKISKLLVAASFASLLCAGSTLGQTTAPLSAEDSTIAAAPQAPAVNEWITWGYDPERTGWNRAETSLTKANVKGLRQVWSTPLGVPTNLDVLSTVTAPVIAAGVAMPGGAKDVMVILGANDVLYALDAATGAQLWQKAYPNPHKPTKPATWLCPNTPNATPTIDKARGLIFFMAGDGLLRGISLTDGAEKMKPVEFIAPFARAWSLNLIDGIVYSTSGRACGEVVDKTSPMYDAARSGLRRMPAGPMLDASAVQAADVRDLGNVRVTRFYTSGARPAAPWGRGGLARGPGNSVYLETSNGRYDPAAGDFSESILRLAPQATRLMDSFTPTNYAHNLAKDLSGSASPVVFNFAGKTLVAYSQKESVLRILDANALGGDNHMTPLWASPRLVNDAETGTDPGRGVWGAITTYENPQGRRFLYIPMNGEPSVQSPAFPLGNGPTPNGRVMAFEMKNDGGKISAVPVWTSEDMIMPDPPVDSRTLLIFKSPCVTHGLFATFRAAVRLRGNSPGSPHPAQSQIHGISQARRGSPGLLSGSRVTSSAVVRRANVATESVPHLCRAGLCRQISCAGNIPLQLWERRAPHRQPCHHNAIGARSHLRSSAATYAHRRRCFGRWDSPATRRGRVRQFRGSLCGALFRCS